MPKTEDVEKAKEWSIKFHEAYERLAPEFGYVTRPECRVLDFSQSNAKLMVAVMQEVLLPALTERGKEVYEECAHIAESLSILADHEKNCCGDIPEMMLRKEIARVIRAKAEGLKP